MENVNNSENLPSVNLPLSNFQNKVSSISNNQVAGESQVSINEYIERVEWLATTKSDFIFPNSSAIHANIVLSKIIKYSEKEVRIYDDKLDGDIAGKEDYLIDEMTDSMNTFLIFYVTI